MLFEPRLCSKIKEAQKTQQHVALENCTLKRNHDVFEIHVNNRTSIVPSPKYFKIEEDSVIKVVDLRTLKELRDLAEHQQVSVRGKIQSISALVQLLVDVCCGRSIVMKLRKATVTI